MPNDLEAIAVFAKVAELGSFRAAADRLRMPKSTVSHRVSELEDRLGARLLERTTRALRLTDAGRRYLAEVVAPLEAIERAGRGVSDHEEEPGGLLRVTAPYEVGQMIFGEVARRYLARHPRVTLELDLTDRRVDLVEEGYDLALRAGALPDSTLVVRKLGQPHGLRLYASPAYLTRQGLPKHPRDLTKHACLCMTGSRTPTLWRFEGKRGGLTVEVQPRLSVNSYQLLAEYVAAGLGLSFLPHVLAAPLLARKRVREVLAPFACPARPWQAVYPSARHLSSKVRVFLELLEECFSQEPWVSS